MFALQCQFCYCCSCALSWPWHYNGGSVHKIYAILDIFGPFWPILDHFCRMFAFQSWSCYCCSCALSWPWHYNGATVHKISKISSILDHFWSFWANLDNFGPLQTILDVFWTIGYTISDNFIDFELNLYLLERFWTKFAYFVTFLPFWNLYHQIDKLRYIPEMSTLGIVVVSESSSQKRLKPLISNSSHLSASGLQFRQKDFATFNQNAITPAAKLISENFSLLPYLLPYY